MVRARSRRSCRARGLRQPHEWIRRTSWQPAAGRPGVSLWLT